ncbi:MAG: signal peptidase I, partial [Parachlamydiales bacterium]
MKKPAAFQEKAACGYLGFFLKLVPFNPQEPMPKNYPIRKSFKILHQTYKDYQNKKSRLTHLQKTQIEALLKTLEKNLFQKDRREASKNAQNLEKLSAVFLKKSFFERGLHFLTSLGIALVIAIVIRQMWFENYTIPTGSMRPTLKEKDFLVVSKTNFALNKPLFKGHFYFQDQLLKHGDIITFTTADMDIPDSDYLYFYLFPGKKQYVKRLIGKPGDTLYFYGGQIYGINSEGKPIEAFQNEAYLSQIEHLPFIRFEGRFLPFEEGFLILQAGQPLVKIQGSQARLFSQDPCIKDYYQLMGIEHYALSQIIRNSQGLCLLFTHHPSIEKVIFEKDLFGAPKPVLATEKSWLPLDEKHLKILFQHLTTCRFNVQDGYGFRLGGAPSDFSPFLGSAIPNGTYEFQDGQAYQINLLGIATKVKPSHPLAQYSQELAVTLYNLGIEMHTFYAHENSPLK